MLRFYSSLDAGAPVLAGTYFARLRQILMACLVDGYVGKPAAGWTLAHNHVDGFALGNGEGFACFAYQDTSRTLAYILETITDTSSKVPGGDNVQYISDGLAGGSGGLTGSNVHWVVAADDKTAIMMFGSGLTTADSTHASSGAQVMPLYIGRYINALGLSPAFCLLGWTENSSPWAGRIGVVTNNVTGRLLRNPFTGLVDQGTGPRYGAGVCSAAGGLATQSYTPQQSRLSPIRLPVMGFGAGISGGTVASGARPCGWLRGLISEPSLSSVLLPQVLGLFGKPNTWQQRASIITLPNGKELVPFYSGPRDMGYFISLDPADWG